MRLTSPEEAAALYERMGPAVETSGGSAANTCAGIASFGGQAGFAGKVGRDQFASVFAHDIRSIGVSFHRGESDSENPTGRCLILVTPDGERTMNTNLGAAAEFAEADLDHDAIQAAQIVYLEGYLFDPPAARKPFSRRRISLAATAPRSPSRSPIHSASTATARRFATFIRDRVDIVFANERELLSLYPGASFRGSLRRAPHRMRSRRDHAQRERRGHPAWGEVRQGSRRADREARRRHRGWRSLCGRLHVRPRVGPRSRSLRTPWQPRGVGGDHPCRPASEAAAFGTGASARAPLKSERYLILVGGAVRIVRKTRGPDGAPSPSSAPPFCKGTRSYPVFSVFDVQPYPGVNAGDEPDFPALRAHGHPRLVDQNKAHTLAETARAERPSLGAARS